MFGAWWQALINALISWASTTGPVPVSGTVATSNGLTDAQLRAVPVPVSGTVTASGPLTDAQLRATPVPVSGTVTTVPGTVVTYTGATLSIVSAAGSTVVLAIGGSASKTVRVRRIIFSGISTAVQTVRVATLKYSTAWTGGTSAAITLVPHDSASAAASATAVSYTANPVAGTLVGVLDSQEYSFVVAAGATTMPALVIGPTGKGEAWVLRGTAEQIVLSLGGVTVVGGSLQMSVELTEE